MTTTELGKQVKALHPRAYDSVDDTMLGRAMQKRFPGLYGDPKEDLDSGTTPETPETLKIQLGQLRDGMRRAVFVARGSKLLSPADYNARRLTVPAGDIYFNPKLIKPPEIHRMVREHRLNELLGDAEQGYGAPPKEELQAPVNAVVSRTPSGETVQGALTDTEHAPETVKAAEKITPPGGSISMEHPAKEIARRIKFSRPKAGQKWPAPTSR